MSLCNFDKWREIGASPTVIDWLQQGVTIPFISEPPSCEIPNRRLTRVQESFLNSEINVLVNDNIIKRCSTKPKVISPLNVVPKKGKNKWRLIIDLRYVNSFIDTPKFSNEKIDVVYSLVQEKDQLVSIDLKNGFFHVPVSDAHQSYLGFKWNNSYFCWQRLPFGLSVSPYFFEKNP